ncbi:MAG: hypothetical protein Q9207_002058 [Kuettlingeria erythrocarpa]
MPRDSHLLSPMSQALLKAARSSEVAKKLPSQPLLEDDKENGEDDEPTGDVETGFMAKRWAAVPRHLEGPELEFLAKRRKGLPSAYTGPPGQASAIIPMRKTKVKKVDADGSATVLDVLVPEGHTVDGEVVEGEAGVTQAPAPGTVVEGVGVANAEGVIVAGDQMLPTPPRRRPPPPKRKAKGLGRVRKKKKVAFASGPAGQDPVDSLATPSGTAGGPRKPPEEEHEIRAADGDISMHYHRTLSNGEESSEESDEGEEGDEGDKEDDEVDKEDDEGDKEDGELSPSPPASKSPPFSPLQEQPPSAILEEERHVIDGTDLEMLHKNAPEDSELLTEKNVPIPSYVASDADEEMVAIPHVSKPLYDAISAPGNEEQSLTLDELPDVTDQVNPDIPVAAGSPVEHNPSGGLIESNPLNSDARLLEEESSCSDGEVDLLGSLEKQLNSNESIGGR